MESSKKAWKALKKLLCQALEKQFLSLDPHENGTQRSMSHQNMHKINAIDYHNEPNISNVSISGIQNTLIPGRGGCLNNQRNCSKIRYITTQFTQTYYTSYYNQASIQTVEGQQMFSNPQSSSTETFEGQYTFGYPSSRSTKTVVGQYTLATPVQVLQRLLKASTCWQPLFKLLSDCMLKASTHLATPI